MSKVLLVMVIDSLDDVWKDSDELCVQVDGRRTQLRWRDDGFFIQVIYQDERELITRINF